MTTQETTDLVTRAEFEKLPPRTQGYVHYMQAAWPKSELRGVKCPYEPGTTEYLHWQGGEYAAMLEAQDGDD